jgi:hypothetical protein
MSAANTYVGIDNDLNGGMTDTGKIIRDGWAFGLIERSETCAGWNVTQIEALWQRVQEQWQANGFRVANLPEPMRTRYLEIQSQAMERARDAGWDPEHDISDEE